jgi:hypothetical protein
MLRRRISFRKRSSLISRRTRLEVKRNLTLILSLVLRIVTMNQRAGKKKMIIQKKILNLEMIE